MAKPRGEGGAAGFKLLPVQRTERVAGDGSGVRGRAPHEQSGEHGLILSGLGRQEGLGGCCVARVKVGRQALPEKTGAGVGGQNVDVLGGQPPACFEAAESGMEEKAHGMVRFLGRAGVIVFGFRLILPG